MCYNVTEVNNMADSKIHRCDEPKSAFLPVGLCEQFESIVSNTQNEYTYSDILKLIDFYLLHPLNEEKNSQSILRDTSHWRIKSKDKQGNEITKLYPDKFFHAMLKISDLKDDIIWTYTDKKTKEALKSMDLDNSLICASHPRAVLNMDCKKEIIEDNNGNLIVNISNSEAGYKCLFRHIRNALAHNNIFFYENGNILLKDFQRDGDKQKDNKVTAAILIKFDTLFEWIKLIETEQENNEE